MVVIFLREVKALQQCFSNLDDPLGGGVKRLFHRGRLEPLENKDIYDLSQQQNYSYEVALKIILGLGFTTAEELY